MIFKYEISILCFPLYVNTFSTFFIFFRRHFSTKFDNAFLKKLKTLECEDFLFFAFYFTKRSVPKVKYFTKRTVPIVKNSKKKRKFYLPPPPPPATAAGRLLRRSHRLRQSLTRMMMTLHCLLI